MPEEPVKLWVWDPEPPIFSQRFSRKSGALAPDKPVFPTVVLCAHAIPCLWFGISSLVNVVAATVPERAGIID